LIASNGGGLFLIFVRDLMRMYMYGRRLVFLFLCFLYGLTTPSLAQREGVTGVFMGTVTTPSGAPVANAQIVVIPADQALVGRQNRHRTDQEGTFRLRLPVGQYWVQVGAVGFVPHWYEDAQGRSEAVPVVISEPGAEVVWPVVVTPIASVFGQVVDVSSGQRVDAGVVLIEGLATRLRKRAVIADGFFIAEGLIPGPYRIQALVAGYVTEEAGVVLGVGDALGPIQVALSKGLSVSGRVMGQSGEVIEGVAITARSVSRDDRMQGAVSLADGTYQISGLVPGAYTLEARKVGFVNQFYNGQNNKIDATVLLFGEDQVRTGVNFVLGQVGAIVGQVTDAQNQPIVGARVVAEPLGKGQRQQARSDKDGHYVLAQVAKGAYLVRAVADGYMPFYYDGVQTNGEATSVSVADDTHTDAVNFVLLPGGKIVGQVRDVDSNKSIGDALVSARWLEHQGTWQTQTDGFGNFELGDLPSGDFLLQVQGRRYITGFYEHAQDPGQANQISVQAGKTVSDVTFALTRRQRGDFDGNGAIDFKDLMQLVRHLMGRKDFDMQLDLKEDGEIGVSDLLAFIHLPASKVASEQGQLHWQPVDNDPQILAVELGIDNMPAAKGYVLQVNYDSDAAELLGAHETDTGAFAGHPLLVQRHSGSVLIALDGEDMTPDEKQGSLVQLRFRLKGDATSVPLDIATAWLFAEDGQLVPVGVPAKFMLAMPPQAFRLMQNVPNPFNPTTTIAFELPEAVDVDVAVYNLVGQRLRTLVSEHKAPGRYQVVWDGKDDSKRDVSSGVYFYRYRAGDFWATRRMLLVR
jgi:hypothetical protein